MRASRKLSRLLAYTAEASSALMPMPSPLSISTKPRSEPAEESSRVIAGIRTTWKSRMATLKRALVGGPARQSPSAETVPPTTFSEPVKARTAKPASSPRKSNRPCGSAGRTPRANENARLPGERPSAVSMLKAPRCDNTSTRAFCSVAPPRNFSAATCTCARRGGVTWAAPAAGAASSPSSPMKGAASNSAPVTRTSRPPSSARKAVTRASDRPSSTKRGRSNSRTVPSRATRVWP